MDVFSPEDFRLAQAVPAPLLEWYGRCKRQLPWRDTGSSYYTWVSEIMLQQTRVEAVRGYFLRFIQALPTVEALATCGEDALMKLWEGLGYYSRARNLQKAARLVVERHGGVLPADYQALLALPGVGEYTAGAVASIAYGIPVPCVDGNVQRVLSRILANDQDITAPAVKRAYRELAGSMIPPSRAGDFNQSLMELGALVCLPGGPPQCGSCPAAGLCRAHQEGCETAYPVKPPKAARRVQQRTVCVVLCGDRVLLCRRPNKGLLAGLWEFPTLEGQPGKEAAARHLEALGLEIRAGRTLKKAKHIFTHIEWRMEGCLFYAAQALPLPGYVWAGLEELRREYALPSALSAYSSQLERWVEL